MKHLALPRALFLALVSSVAFWAVALGVVLAFAMGYAIGQSKVFPLEKPLPVENNFACKTLDDAKEVADALASEEEEVAAIVQMTKQALGLCGFGEGSVVYHKLLHEKEGWRVYSFSPEGSEKVYFEVTDWRHAVLEI